MSLRRPGSTVPDSGHVAVTVRAPATSANLGPGFDSLGLCLDLADVVTLELTDRGTSVIVRGEGASELPTDDTHLVIATMRQLFDRWDVAQPGLRLRCHNAIPQGRGLGSSAAAICAGVRMAGALARRSLSLEAELRLAAEIEGHPDNVAACLLGGLTIAWTDAVGAQAVSLDVATAVLPVVLVAPTGLLTTVARSVLPATATHREASENSARAALLVAALTTHPELLLPATVDGLHQEARRPALEPSMALLDEMRAAGVAAVLSGAGPSVLALCRIDQLPYVVENAPPGWQAQCVRVARPGMTSVPG